MRTNLPKRTTNKIFTHENARALITTPINRLRRTVLSCMLWEKSFYEDGQSAADRIAELVPHVKTHDLHELVIQARTKMFLRHVPLLIILEMCKHEQHKIGLSHLIPKIIRRPDEIGEIISLYWRDGRKMLPNQLRKGLAKSFKNFDEYQLAKWNKDAEISMQDAIRLAHPKPENAEQSELWRRVANKELSTPYTWETVLSKDDGRSKAEKWNELIHSGRLPVMAFIRNLRNMEKAGLDRHVVSSKLAECRPGYTLPFRFVTSAIINPQFAGSIERVMMKRIRDKAGSLKGHTCILIDVSGSMEDPITSRSEVERIKAASGLAIVLAEMCEYHTIVTFSEEIIEIGNKRGLDMIGQIWNSQEHRGTLLGLAIKCMFGRRGDAKSTLVEKWYSGKATMNQITKPSLGINPTRLIVITDEQSHDEVKYPKELSGNGYMINVATYQNGVGYGKWIHIDGWSDAIAEYIHMFEYGNVWETEQTNEGALL